MIPKLFWLITIFLLAFLNGAEAQQQKKIPRIGYLAGFGNASDPGGQIKAFRQGLKELGYIEGTNIIVEYRYIEGIPDRVPKFVGELVHLNLDALVIPHADSTLAAKKATQTIPIIIISTVDPVASGIVESLARPGGNITGISRLTRELSGKRLEVLKEVAPKISRVGVLLAGDDETSKVSLKDYEAAAPMLKLALFPIEVRAPKPDVTGAFHKMTNQHANALVVVRSPTIRRSTTEIVELAIQYRLPCMCEGNDMVEAGGLVSYSTSDTEDFRRAATYVDKILKGAKPADLPIEQPTKFEFVINLKTAKQIRLTIPQKVLARADRVIK
jgi:putative ABC transport system substrate-binding protein